MPYPSYTEAELAAMAGPTTTVVYDSAIVVPEPVSKEHAWDILKITPKLPYFHISWPWENAALTHADAGQLARIIGSVGLDIYYATETKTRDTMELCRDYGAKMVLKYAPWHSIWASKNAVGHGMKFAQELQQAADLLEAQRGWIDSINLEAEFVGNEVEPEYFWINQEILRADLDEDGNADPDGGVRADQKAALLEKNNMIYDIVKDDEFFPDITLMMHAFPIGPYWAKTEKNDGYAMTEFYSNNDRAARKYKVDEHVELAAQYSLSKVIPVMAFGGYYDTGIVTGTPYYSGYVRSDEVGGLGGDLAYPVRRSWECGRYFWYDYFRNQTKTSISSRANYGKTYGLTHGALWPAPFEAASDGYPHHFIAYCWGAQNHKLSENDWFDSAKY